MYVFFCFADSQRLMHRAYSILFWQSQKTRTKQTWFLMDGTTVLETWFLDIEWYSTKVFYYNGSYRKFA